MKKSKSEEELIALLESIPASQNKVNSSTGKMISEIVLGMRKEKFLNPIDQELVFEITLADGTYLCSLDIKQKLNRVFLINDVL